MPTPHFSCCTERQNRRLLRLVLIIASVLIVMVAATPAKGGPFPFGPYLSWAFIFMSLLIVWCAIRLHSPWERKAVLYGFLSGAAFGGVGVVAGILDSVFLSDKDLTALVGFFVWGPICFIAGGVAGVLQIIRRNAGTLKYVRIKKNWSAFIKQKRLPMAQVTTQVPTASADRAMLTLGLTPFN